MGGRVGWVEAPGEPDKDTYDDGYADGIDAAIDAVRDLDLHHSRGPTKIKIAARPTTDSTASVR